MRKTFFYIHTNIVTKKYGGHKTHETIFPETNEKCELKMLGKKSSGKSAKKVFLYLHEYRDQKMGGEKRAKQFLDKHTNSASKKCWEENRRKKVRKTLFYIYTNIVTKKWGGKKRENIFPETHE